ncbi:MAG TPA: hypothetical protein DIW31_04695 [Bacteroidales bacterium]|nr:hypothetical protein [Bacteroidales bacterium]
MKSTKLLWYITGILLAINLVFYLGGFNDTMLLYVSDILPVICSFIAVICLFIAYKGFKGLDLTKISWFMIFLGILLSFVAETLYGILEIIEGLNMNDTFPSIADYFWCIGYIPLFIGLAIMFVNYKRSGFPLGNTRIYVMLILLYLVLFSVVSYFLLIPIINDPETNGIQTFFYLFYPIGDIFLVIPAAILMYITSLFGRGIISRPWKYLAIGFLCFSFADLLYSYLSWQGKYESGNMIDAAWHLGYLLIALSGLYQRDLVKEFN